MKKIKAINVILCILLIISVPLAAIAVKSIQNADNRNGGFHSGVVNRVDFSADKTIFSLNGENTLSFVFSVKKTQADFYALINSFNISGIEYDSLTFSALNDASQGLTLSQLRLPAENGEPVQLSWELSLTLPQMPAGTYFPSIEIEYRSGMTEISSETYLLTIPLEINIS